MEINIKLKENSPGILAKLSLILLGAFSCSVIFAISSQYLHEIGVWLGLLLNIALIFFGLRHLEKGSKLRLVVWGMLGTLVIIIIALVAGLILISQALEGF